MPSQSITVQRIRGGTLFKTIIVGSVIGCSVLGVLFGILAALGIETVKFNGEYIVGIGGLISAPLIGLLIGAIFGLMTSVVSYIGLRILSRFKPITIEFIPIQELEKTTSD